MTLRATARTTRRGVEARLLRSLGTDRRERLVTELVRVAGAVSSPSAQGALYRAIASQALAWPMNHKLDEIHTSGLYAVVRDTARVDGAIVECGVGHGKSLVSLARAAELFCPGKAVYGFDSFAGFPAAVAEDVGTRVATIGAAPKGWTDTSLELVSSLLDAPAQLVPGFFEDTLEEFAPARISLLHVDCDMYESTATVLRVCAPRVQSGGIVILDEYREDRWPGATRAIDEVFGSKEICWEPALARFIVRV